MWEIMGGVAAGFAVFQGLGLIAGWLRRRHTRSQLRASVRRFLRLDRRLTAIAAEITWKFKEGVGWSGWAIWPRPLEGHITYLEGLTAELEHDIANVRGLNADASLERLRTDVEQLGERLREVFETYLHGTIGTYQLSNGKPIEFSATGRAPVAPLANEDGHGLIEQRRRIRLLFRSTAYRLNEEDWTQVSTAQWALLESDLPDDTEPLWEGEPRPG